MSAAIKIELSSNNCTICGGWPEKYRWARREMIEGLPLDDDPICDECLTVFWQRLINPPEPSSNH